MPPIQADPDRVVQVLINLLSNAAKFVEPDAGRVVVELFRDPDALRVQVTDNGPGISVENQKVIFEKFRQAGDTMTEKPEGTGLGLPISRQIIEHLGGRLWVRERARRRRDVRVRAADLGGDCGAPDAAVAAAGGA